ncbi:MAG: pyruvate formate lyase family protein, partial [Oscillospiraceae bacterium]|nr:pyruvate formate lyase family protein [Oscillospiraceae bacterium]
MTNYKNPDIRLEFTERMKKVKENIHSRLRRRDERECCWLNTVSNHGMNPFADVFEENPDEAYVINLANAIVRSWLVTEKVIYPHETIVGIVRPNYPAMEHFSSGIVIQYDDAMEKLGYCKEEIERTKALSNRFMPHRSADLPSPSKKYGRELFDAIRSEQIFSEGYQGHTIPNYVTLFDLGLDGVLDKVNYWAEKNVKDKDSADLYEAYRIIVCGMSAYLESYADYARKLFETEKDPTQKRYYAEIAENCDFVAHKKPVTLYQTIQLMWVLSLWDWVDCLGRVDQFLYPYYLYSKEHGDVITPEESITSLMFKIWEGGSHNSTLSGSKPEDGSDATNELSFLFLQVLRNIHDTHPRMVVRIREDVDPALMRLIVRLWSEGMSDPTVVSDTNVIPGLQRLGIPLEDARNYATLGCQEIEIPGKSNTGCEDGTFCIPKVLEIAMRGGMSTRAEFSGQIGPRTKTLSECETFEEFYASFEEQIKYFTEVHCYLASCTQMKRAVNHSKLVKGVFTDGVLESGKNHDDGGPIYGYGVMETAGLAAAADSLVAIKKLIFDDKTMTAEQLTDILAANFEGYEKERQYMLNRIPKFG